MQKFENYSLILDVDMVDQLRRNYYSIDQCEKFNLSRAVRTIIWNELRKFEEESILKHQNKQIIKAQSDGNSIHLNANNA